MRATAPDRPRRTRPERPPPYPTITVPGRTTRAIGSDPATSLQTVDSVPSAAAWRATPPTAPTPPPASATSACSSREEAPNATRCESERAERRDLLLAHRDVQRHDQTQQEERRDHQQAAEPEEERAEVHALAERLGTGAFEVHERQPEGRGIELRPHRRPNDVRVRLRSESARPSVRRSGSARASAPRSRPRRPWACRGTSPSTPRPCHECGSGRARIPDPSRGSCWHRSVRETPASGRGRPPRPTMGTTSRMRTLVVRSSRRRPSPST